MAKCKDIAGQRFGRLVAIESIGKDKFGSYSWFCKCDCGKTTKVVGSSLRKGNTKSCGCLAKEISSVMIGKNNNRTKHGKKHTRIYYIWGAMKQRCFNRMNKNYADYGGRGISVCKEWVNDFQAFYDWAMNNGYKEGLTIDRINVNGNYEPSNCRWATYYEQAHNCREKKNTIRVNFNGELLTLREIEKQTGVPYSTLYFRYKKQGII